MPFPSLADVGYLAAVPLAAAALLSLPFAGSGYPDGLAGEEIPLGARVIAVCDAFTAMTSPRPYAPQRTLPEAIAALRQGAGTQFDPAVVDAFAELVVRPAWPARSGSITAGNLHPAEERG